MSKKHFIAMANVLRYRLSRWEKDGIEYALLWEMVNDLAVFCKQANPRFNRDRWLDYIAGKCGPNGGSIKKAA